MGQNSTSWNLDTGLLISALDHERDVNSATCLADKKQLVTCCDDKNAYVWDIHAVLKEGAAGTPSLNADATRRLTHIKGASRIPQGFFDDVRDRVHPSTTHHPHPFSNRTRDVTPSLGLGARAFFGRMSSLFHRAHPDSHDAKEFQQHPRQGSWHQPQAHVVEVVVMNAQYKRALHVAPPPNKKSTTQGAQTPGQKQAQSQFQALSSRHKLAQAVPAATTTTTTTTSATDTPSHTTATIDNPHHIREIASVEGFHLGITRKEMTMLDVDGSDGMFPLTLCARWFNGLWCTRGRYNKQWVPDRYSSVSPVGARDTDDYFYLNIRPESQGGKFCYTKIQCMGCVLKRSVENPPIVLSDFSSVLVSFLRTVFVDDKPLEYPIHRLFQKMKVLRSRLEDARDLLGAPQDSTSTAEVFGFNVSSGSEAAAEYIADLVVHLGKLLEVVEAECNQTAKKLEESLSNNKISFDLLEYYYEEGGSYAYNIGIEIDDVDVERRIVLVGLKRVYYSDQREQLFFEMEHFEWDGVGFQKRTVTIVQQSYQGTREVSSLVLQRMTDEMLAKVTERGRLYLSYSRICYAEYYDDTRMRDELVSSYHTVKPRTRRVIIDPIGFHRAQQGYSPDLCMPLPDNVEEYVARLPYWIGGCDLEAREWRTFRVWDLKPIEYDQEAWSKLILETNTKDLIKALVDTTGCSLGTPHPVRMGKGKNVLLNGPLGTGRMTTVHAVCNLFKRPLFTMSAHDFPDNKWDLVPYIANHMALAATWNAVFLKGTYPRDKDDVHATLRQFESDDCISFWVTTVCDKDLLRLFSAVVDFPELDAAARRRLWLCHFGQEESAGLKSTSEHTLVSSSLGDEKKTDYLAHLREIEKLSWYQLDGKMIENIMRSARALAASNREHLSTHHVKVVMKSQRLDNLPLWRKLTRFLTLPAGVLRTGVVNQ
ncbi:hypothetical protein DEU56DRAFT_918460 [Suillus clintonianus]|uniref:uncharacterized protein n=1 Tax=Suillus clintonianus TaxID=1904413 RepID=UPI001B85C09A|nr:uncharacterized protein DEU56DRAFT_918460 [Suillus clintonianus]KAG2120128.1 hypothetical protein DEU56DRAFT_918460 [Suillus clintonianus]